MVSGGEIGIGRGGCEGDGGGGGEGATGMRESQEGKVDRAAEASEREGGDFGGAQGEELKPVERSSGRGGPWRR